MVSTHHVLGNGGDVRFASFVSIIRVSCLARSDRGVVNKLEQMLSISSNDSKLFAMLAQGIELVSKGCLELLAGDVGQLCLCDEGLGFGADEFLLEDHNLGRVGFLVFQLGNVVGDLLFS